MNKSFTYPCGCSFKVLEEREDGQHRIDVNFTLENIPLDCARTWKMFSDGNVKGIFQLENQGRICKEVKPENISQLSAICAIIRPGCSEAMRDGKSITQHYIDRKNGVEEVEYFHPALEHILEDTFGEMIYQEQAMRVAQDIAGFDMQQADILRKAIGKKNPQLMAEVKTEFLEGCDSQDIVNKEEAEEIFSWIEKSQRYSFNKSHSVSYATNAYLTAYSKAHFPRGFITSYLNFAHEKPKPFIETYQLIQNARSMNIDVQLPSLERMNTHFVLENRIIYFGLSDIKSIGEKVVGRIQREASKVGKPVADWSWVDFLVLFSQSVPSTAIKNMISTGAVTTGKLSRTNRLYEYDVYTQLTEREHKAVVKKHLAAPYKSLEDILADMLEGETGRNHMISSDKRATKIQGLLKSLKNPSHTMEDSPSWISSAEERLLGISITYSAVDACDIGAANCNCQEFVAGFNGRGGVIMLPAKIDSVKEIKTKSGQNPGRKMGFLSVSDTSGSCEIVVFPDPWEQYSGFLCEDNTVMLTGKRGRENNSLIAEKIWQL